MKKAELIDHLVKDHDLSRFDLERRLLPHLVHTHDWRHSATVEKPLVDAGGNADYGIPNHTHERP